jgi:hypothetical protein
MFQMACHERESVLAGENGSLRTRAFAPLPLRRVEKKYTSLLKGEIGFADD